MKVVIDGKDYEIKKTKLGFTLGTMFLFKRLTGKNVYEISDLEDMVYLLYSALKSSNKEFDYTFETLCEYIDENPELLNNFNNINTSTETEEDKKKI